MSKKLIIFDFDGVLFDSTKLVSGFIMSAYPTMTEEIINEMFCGNFPEEMAKAKLTHERIQETPEEKAARSSQYSAKKLVAPLFEGILALLKTLHDAGHTLAINTSALDKNCLPLLERAGILGLFDTVATKDMSVSKVEKFKILQEKYGVAKEDILFVTDTLGDLREADVAGVPTVAVTYGVHTRAHFLREPHNNLVTIVDSVQELADVLQK
jgi:phosphoglycolate phosphatase